MRAECTHTKIFKIKIPQNVSCCRRARCSMRCGREKKNRPHALLDETFGRLGSISRRDAYDQAYRRRCNLQNPMRTRCTCREYKLDAERAGTTGTTPILGVRPCAQVSCTTKRTADRATRKQPCRLHSGCKLRNAIFGLAPEKTRKHPLLQNTKIESNLRLLQEKKTR